MNVKNVINKFKTNINSIFIFTTWVILWFSINSMPGEINYMFNSQINFLNGSRTILSILFSLISIVYVIYLWSIKKLKNKSIILYLFSLYFFLQIVGLLENNNRTFDIHNTYLILYSFGAISILIILDNLKLYNSLNHFFIFFLIILFFAYTIIMFSSSDVLNSLIDRGNLYSAFHPDKSFFFQSPPRITGLTRSAAIICIFLIALFISDKKFKLVKLILILILSTVIWLGQSRGSLLCFWISCIFLIFFFNNFNLKKKFLFFTFVILIPILFSNISINILKTEKTLIVNEKNTSKPNKNNNALESSLESSKDNVLNFIEKPRVMKANTSSGRLELWQQAINEYDFKKIFGYGPQADRLLLEDMQSKFSNNVSNVFIYSFLTSGYFGLIFLIIINIYTIMISFEYLKQNQFFSGKLKLKKSNIISIVSLTYIIFFLIRSLFENSYGVFSIDFLIMIVCIFIIEKSKNNKIKI